MKNKKAVAMMMRSGNHDLTLSMFQRSVGMACDNLKRRGKYEVSKDFKEQVHKTAHKYREFLTVEIPVEGNPFANKCDGYTLEMNITFEY